MNVLPMKGVMKFGTKGKLSPQYIGPYRISNRVGNVAYELELPSELAAVHPIFHIYMLKKCLVDPSLIVPTENIGIKENLSYEEIPVQILDRQVRRRGYEEEIPHLFSSELVPVQGEKPNNFLENNKNPDNGGKTGCSRSAYEREIKTKIKLALETLDFYPV
ncbi:hypothetical protein MTR67_003699 [Solanum verrucosum]|uniref:Tf2-1-like SH3-like domain-containing protein n=1 Tax=Solanum verrucosum TaxID=315347 RepID=A0AAF0T9X2_SOLVR|nr:hypothetical protein MTR67_003699 [Solanum verrucosum]